MLSIWIPQTHRTQGKVWGDRDVLYLGCSIAPKVYVHIHQGPCINCGHVYICILFNICYTSLSWTVLKGQVIIMMPYICLLLCSPACLSISEESGVPHHPYCEGRLCCRWRPGLPWGFLEAEPLQWLFSGFFLISPFPLAWGVRAWPICSWL